MNDETPDATNSGTAASTSPVEKRPYQPPQVMVMDEADVLKVFQITSAGASWWG